MLAQVMLIWRAISLVQHSKDPPQISNEVQWNCNMNSSLLAPYSYKHLSTYKSDIYEILYICNTYIIHINKLDDRYYFP